MASSHYRGPAPTLTEDDLREQGERMTLPPPVPMDELVSQMMDPSARDTRPEIEHRTLPPPDAARVENEACAAYTATLGGLRARPILALTPASALKDYLARSVLAAVDGEKTVEKILDVVPLTRIDALRYLCELLEGGFIVML